MYVDGAHTLIVTWTKSLAVEFAETASCMAKESDDWMYNHRAD